MPGTPDRPLRVGLLNMMADGALRATERQFARLVGADRKSSRVDLVVFTLPELERSAPARAHVQERYATFARVRQEGLDALIITGINLGEPRLEGQVFWEPLIRVFDWAGSHVAGVLCSCLATHAVLQFHHGQRRAPLGAKLWGVFTQDVAAGHPLTRGLPPRVPVPHSRHNDVTADQMEAAGLQVLVQGGGAGAHLAAGAEMRLVVMQGHPEYDAVSLLKEYKREVEAFRTGRRDDYPPVPVGYLDPAGLALVEGFRSAVLAGDPRAGEFPEAAVREGLADGWAAWTRVFFTNWLAALRRPA